MPGDCNGVHININCCDGGGGGGFNYVIPFGQPLLFKAAGSNPTAATGDWRLQVNADGNFLLDNYDGTTWQNVTRWDKIV